jgi:HNH endonuclease
MAGTQRQRRIRQVKWRGGDWRAHRLSFALSFGQIPDGLLVLHHCDNPACCNPRHLFLGTHADNMRDKAKKGHASRHGGTASGDRHGSRTKPNRVPRGEKHGNAKLTDTQVAAILASEKTQRALAREYGVSQTTISNIRLGKIWRLIFEHRFFGMPQMAWLHRDEGKP